MQKQNQVFDKNPNFWFFPDRPRICQKVTVVVGNPIQLEPILDELRKRNASLEEQRRVVTDVVQKQLYKLRVISEVLHARHISGGWFSGPIPSFTLSWMNRS